MATASVVFHSRFRQVASAIVTAQARACAEAGRRIAEDARSRMQPGYFYDSGASKQQTAYHQTSRTEGEVRIGTPYAAYVELGTVHAAPRPVLRPAIDHVWPQLPALARAACAAMDGVRLGQTLPPIKSEGGGGGGEGP